MTRAEKYEKAKLQLLKLIEKDYGKPCLTKDTDDFDDLITVGDPDAGRCPVCIVYERLDKLWETLDLEYV